VSRSKARSLIRRTAGMGLLVGAALVWALGSSAAAAPAGAPVSGDARATAYAGNVTTCAGAGLAGNLLTTGFTVVSDGTYLTVTADPGVTITGVVVKGGAAYNVYPGGLFADGTEAGLHAPLVGSPPKTVPQISHYFVCGTTGSTTTEPSNPSGAPAFAGSDTGANPYTGTQIGLLSLALGVFAVAMFLLFGPSGRLVAAHQH